MRQSMTMGLPALVGLAFAGVSPALAQAAGAAAGVTAAAPAGDLWSYVTPAVTTIGSGLVGIAVTWVAARFHALTGIAIAQKYQDDVHSAAETGIHLALDKAGAVVGDAVAAKAKTGVIGDAMAWVERSVPTALTGLGITPDQLSDLVAAKFNALTGAAAVPSPSGPTAAG